MDYATRRPIDYVPLPTKESGFEPDPLTLDIRKLLTEKWSVLGDCLNIRPTFKKQEKTPFTLVCYFVLMFIAFGLL